MLSRSVATMREQKDGNVYSTHVSIIDV